MYKKPFSVQGQNLLSKKDIKGIRTQLAEQYPGLDEKVVDELLPEGQTKVLKLDNRCLLYVVGDDPPALFDAEGRGELYPTLNTLWKHPYMMQELTIHAPVSKFVLNGADLMLPGLIVPANGVAGFGSVTKGQKRCIKIEGNIYPIAVGKMLVNQTQMEKLKGKGLEVCHVFKDTLWAYSGKVIPNSGFTEKDDEITPCGDAYVPGQAPAPTAAAAADAAEGDATPKAAEEAPAPGGEATAGGESPAAAAGAAAPTSRAAADWSQDDLLEFCFMQGFKTSLTDDKLLPVEASKFYEDHMKPSRPEGTTLDVKKSSHKQIGKFLNAMRKAKVIDVNEKKGVISITKVDRGHKQFAALEKKFADDCSATTASSNSKAAASSAIPPPTITAMWKPTHYTENLWKLMGKSKNDLCTWEEAKMVLVEYLKKENLWDGDEEKAAKLNEELINALIKTAGGTKKDQKYPEEMPVSQLEDKLQERLTEHTTIDVQGLGPTTRKGPAMKIEVTLSRKGAHNVTRICNLEAYGIDIQALGDELKKKLNCTVHIEDMPGKNTKDKMMQLQGHVAQELEEKLQESYGITKAFMSVK